MKVRAGEIDWVAAFAAMARASDVRAAPRPAERSEEGDRWRDRAARFDRLSREDGAASRAIEGLAPLVREHDVVLDVGAGTGRHAIPLAARCARVVAIEPSPAMRARLLARIAEEQLTNVEVRDAAWPDLAAPVGDVVFSAHVAYGVVDVAPFLEAMTARARRTCALLLKLRAPADALGEVFAAVHGVARPRRPAALEALAVLHQLGCAAELTLVEGSSRAMTFRDVDDDLRELALRVGLDGGAEAAGRVRRALESVAAPIADGWSVGETGPTTCITWPGRAG